jgi:iron complex outermembrane receptor protein
LTRTFFLAGAAAAALLPYSPAHAQDAVPPIVQQPRAEQPEGNAARAHPDKHDEENEIVITGNRARTPDVIGGVAVLDSQELVRDARPSLGETLQDLPGVTASSFGPSASRPIIRGLSGERAAILVDGISSLDLSASDPDHAVTINPLTAERIEIQRGAGALLYGSSAIGGVVNVIDTRIPRHVPDRLAGDAMLNYGSAANERSANAQVDVPVGGHFVLHADGAYSRYDDLHVGGYLLTAPLRAQAMASPDPAIRALADLKGTLPNTAGRSDDAAAGLAYADGDLNIGISYSHHDAKYGVPIRFSLDPLVEAEAPTIDAHQDRGDIRANVPVGGFFKLVGVRGGISKYHHDELNSEGGVETSFFSDGGEIRADLVQAERNGWGGTSGVQYRNQDARIVGDEKYLPNSRERRLGFFTLQSVARGPLKLEAAGRIESNRLHADEDAQIAANGGPIGASPISRSFTPVSGALGASYDVVPGWQLGLSLSHSERSPSIQELFANGAHGGSQQFLVGDPALAIEKSNGAELSLKHTIGPVHVEGSLYYSRYASFIYEAPSGIVRDGLPEYRFRQGKADYYGFEVDADARFGRALGIDWGGELTADAVRATIADYGPAPQIPPLRVLAGLTGARGQLDGRIEVEQVAAQRRTAPNETPTPGYTLVNASLDWHPLAANPALTLSLQGSNLFDVEARRHSSELKDYAPLAGRDIRLTARLKY